METGAPGAGSHRRKVRLPRQHRGQVHDRRRGGRRRFLAGRTPDGAAGARGAAAPAQPRGRVQLRARGPDRGAARRRGPDRRAGRPDLQAARPVAHVLERRRRAGADARDHRPGRLRALLRGAGRSRAASRRPSRRRMARALRSLRARDGIRDTVPELLERFERAARRADGEQLQGRKAWKSPGSQLRRTSGRLVAARSAKRGP